MHCLGRCFLDVGQGGQEACPREEEEEEEDAQTRSQEEEEEEGPLLEMRSPEEEEEEGLLHPVGVGACLGSRWEGREEGPCPGKGGALEAYLRARVRVVSVGVRAYT